MHLSLICSKPLEHGGNVMLTVMMDILEYSQTLLGPRTKVAAEVLLKI
jgi:hypothetical protein